jgi:pyruvate kinase
MLDGTDDILETVDQALLQHGLKRGEMAVVTLGMPIMGRGATNLMKIHRVGVKGFYEVF